MALDNFLIPELCEARMANCAELKQDSTSGRPVLINSVKHGRSALPLKPHHQSDADTFAKCFTSLMIDVFDILGRECGGGMLMHHHWLNLAPTLVKLPPSSDSA
jgi:hypothetical protein